MMTEIGNMNWVELGFCRKPHGIKGAFAFHLYNKEESILNKGFRIHIRPLSNESSIAKNGEEVEIQNINFGNKVIVTLKGVENRNKVEEMLPFSIWADREAFPTLEDDELYLADLIGSTVFDEDGLKVGVVKTLAFNGMQDILVIDCEGRIIEVLFIDNFVLNVDAKKKEIIIKVPELI